MTDRPRVVENEPLLRREEITEIDEGIRNQNGFRRIHDSSSQSSSGSSSTCSLNRSYDLCPPQEEALQVKTYKRRFWILFVFSALSCIQCVEWNTWGPISASVISALPGWHSGTIAMMGNWGTITFVIFVFPLLLFLHKRGLRPATLICTLLVAMGTALRCFTLQTPTFTVLCHISAILIGIPGTLVLAAPPLLASVWFPPEERTTATAFCQALNQLGSAVSYLEPLIVRAPGPLTPNESIRDDIRRLMFIAAGISFGLLLCVLLWFPSSPPQPPSLTASERRSDFGVALRSLFRNGPFVRLLVSYSLLLGCPAAWVSVLNFSLLSFDIHQDEAAALGALSIVFSCGTAVGVGSLTDRFFYGHLKRNILILTGVSLAAFVWLLLLALKLFTASKWQVYASVIIGLSANFGASPLFFELAVETAFPAPEAIVGGVLMAGNNSVGIFFLLLFFIPSEEYTWVIYCLVGGTILSLIPFFKVKEEYTRSSIDRGFLKGFNTGTPNFLSASSVEAEPIFRRNSSTNSLNSNLRQLRVE